MELGRAWHPRLNPLLSAFFGTTRALSKADGDPHRPMELTLIFSLFGAVALTLLVPAIRGMFR